MVARKLFFPFYDNVAKTYFHVIDAPHTSCLTAFKNNISLKSLFSFLKFKPESVFVDPSSDLVDMWIPFGK